MAESLGARRRRILAAMGIEVWLPRDRDRDRDRDRGMPATAVVVASTGAAGEVAHSEQVDTPATVHVPAATALQIDVSALSGPGGVVVGHFASGDERRLVQGIYLATAASSEEPSVSRFQWPPPAAIHGGAGDGLTAWGAFLEGQVRRNRATCLVVLGDFGHLPAPDRVEVPIVRGPSVRELRGSPALKRQLWHAIATTKRR
jgi:hypothetical protein